MPCQLKYRNAITARATVVESDPVGGCRKKKQAEQVADEDEERQRADHREVLLLRAVPDDVLEQAADRVDDHLEEVLDSARTLLVEAARGQREDDRDDRRQQEHHDRRVGDPRVLAVGKEELRHPAESFATGGGPRIAINRRLTGPYRIE